MPSWLLDQNTAVLLQRFVRSKEEPICDPVQLLDANPTYAKVRHADSRESTVLTFDLAPFPNASCNRTLDISVNTSAKKPHTMKIVKNSYHNQFQIHLLILLSSLIRQAHYKRGSKCQAQTLRLQAGTTRTMGLSSIMSSEHVNFIRL